MVEDSASTIVVPVAAQARGRDPGVSPHCTVVWIVRATADRGVTQVQSPSDSRFCTQVLGPAASRGPHSTREDQASEALSEHSDDTRLVLPTVWKDDMAADRSCR